jgi:hypothetical protein
MEVCCTLIQSLIQPYTQQNPGCLVQGGQVTGFCAQDPKAGGAPLMGPHNTQRQSLQHIIQKRFYTPHQHIRARCDRQHIDTVTARCHSPCPSTHHVRPEGWQLAVKGLAKPEESSNKGSPRGNRPQRQQLLQVSESTLLVAVAATSSSAATAGGSYGKSRLDTIRTAYVLCTPQGCSMVVLCQYHHWPSVDLYQ